MYVLTHNSQNDIQPECKFHRHWIVSDRQAENVKYVQMLTQRKNFAR